MKRCLERSFNRERDSDLYWDNHPKRVAVLNLSVIHLDPKLIWSVPLKLSDPCSLLDWVLHHRVLPLEVEGGLKGVPAVSSFILGFAVCHKEYVFDLVKLNC